MNHKLKKGFAIISLCLSTSILPYNSVFAENFGESGGGDVVVTDDTGNGGTIDATTNYETNNNSQDQTNNRDETTTNGSQSSNASLNGTNTYKPTIAESEADDAKDSLLDIFKDKINGITQGNIFTGGLNYGGFTSMGTTNWTLDDIADIWRHRNTIANNLNAATADGRTVNSKFNYNKPATANVDTADLSVLTLDQINQLLGLMATAEKLPIVLGTTTNFPITLPGYHQLINPSTNIIVRPDLITGGLHDGSSYLDRFDQFQIYNLASSNFMEDFMLVTAITDYHISELNTEYTTYEDYEDENGNPMIKWQLINRDTGAVVKEETGEYTNMRFSGVPAGNYAIRTLQYKTTTKTIRAYYDVREYLVDSNTQSILYYRDVSVAGANNRDGGKYVELENSKTTEWVEQMTRNVKINSTGSVETNTVGTERTQ